VKVRWHCDAEGNGNGGILAAEKQGIYLAAVQRRSVSKANSGTAMHRVGLFAGMVAAMLAEPKNVGVGRRR
jgi:hypothetical protein